MKKWMIGLVANLVVVSVFGAPSAERIYLSGKGPSDAVEWDFFCSKGRKSGEWTKIQVPSNWEQQGFGNYNYGHDDPATKHDETGTYRTTFMVPKDWEEKHVRLVFEGSMTETSIKINGKTVGAPNHGGYLPFRYILDKTNVKYGEENMLEVLVKKKPDNSSLDQAERKGDYWVFGGIYRPVFLEVQPKDFVNRLAIDARADGSMRLDVFPQVQRKTNFREESETTVDEVVAQVQTLEGVDVGAPISAAIHGATGRVRLKATIKNPKLWSPEYPTLYQVKVTLKNNGAPVSEKTERFGFRTFEMRPEDGFYLNGKRILVQGINRNVFDPQHGRAVDAEKVWADARAIKAMNVNLVRSHMPPTTEFMEACEELGLMVITELCNWHNPYIDTPIARNIAYELVMKYQNYPSVILWANGNENGFNLEIDELYHLYDLQDRPVIHPWSYFEGIDTKHYPSYNMLNKKLNGSVVYLPTEFLHGLYDGGHGAGLEDFWSAMSQSPVSAGGVLWCWGDAAIARTDKDGKLDTDGNHSADGIVGPNGEKEASYYSVREIWSPVQIPADQLPENFKGKLPIVNRYYETRLDECSFEWRLVNYSAPFNTKPETTVRTEGKLKGPKVKPGQTGALELPLPNDWNKADALELTASSSAGVEIMKWSWKIGHDKAAVAESTKVKQAADNPFKVKLGNTVWSFSPKTGQLMSCVVNGKKSGLGNGPVLYAGTLDKVLKFSKDWKAEVSQKAGAVIVKSTNADGSSFKWTLSNEGTVALDYSFATLTNELAYCAVGFDLADDDVVSKRWLGQGPYRIWGNRLRGPQFGLWENDFNDHITGVNWGEPEFKGIFGNVEWMELNLNSGASLLVDAEDAAIGVLQPSNAKGDRNRKNTPTSPIHAWWHYPEAGGLHLFHKLPGTGTKFANAEDLGPQGEPSVISGPISGRVIFQVK
ncbi:glycoside hydrolase family 2 protein [Pontiella sulfatireligans]|uniref:beta-galactosidase n=1 Tax=Pontiella sulfatireligans TaxID=2750658 RepID=A0A6C2UJR6_9BACT|nr:glycoside hydrolase family 2 TIM barrel-domain containing protein [Pontiella sulfatireligans]VGO20465.1 Evolved beta-galactosidase subunit alpha [Pontiella sulfatireligans]